MGGIRHFEIDSEEFPPDYIRELISLGRQTLSLIVIPDNAGENEQIDPTNNEKRSVTIQGLHPWRNAKGQVVRATGQTEQGTMANLTIPADTDNKSPATLDVVAIMTAFTNSDA